MQDYSEYKIAAERHLETCQKLRDVINNSYSAAPTLTEIKKMNELLANIYYLSGYVIECSVSFCILKFIGYDTIKTRYSLNDVNQLRYYHSNAANNNYGVSYAYRDIGNTDITGSYDCRWSIYSKGHKLKQNLTFFTMEAGLSGLNIQGIDLPLDNTMKKMLKKWEAEARYRIVTGYVLQKDKVLDFLNLAEHIHISLISKSQYF